MGVRVVVLASEQLLPAIRFVVHQIERHGPALEAVCIYHTHDDNRSRLPALRLRRLLQSLVANGLAGGVELAAGDGSMASVRAALHAWFCDAPAARWIVDATGGTKPMSAAAVEYTLAAEFVVERKALYLELDGGWGVFDADPTTGLTLLRPPDPGDGDVPRDDVLERRVPLDLLVQTQHLDLVQVRTRMLPTPDLPALCAQAASTRWRWQLAGIESAGAAFECFIAAGLQQAGLHRLAWSAQVLLPGNGSEGGQTPMAETDVVLCRGSTVCCIDIKLPGEASVDARSSQFTRAVHNARQLGGRAVKTIVLRPGWQPDASVNRIAAALGVVLLDQSHAATVFSVLLQHIDPGLALPPVLAEVQALLATHQARTGGPLLSTLASMYVLGEDQSIDFDATAMALMDHLRRPWVLVQLGPGAYRLQVSMGHDTWAAPPDRPALRSGLLSEVARRPHPARPRVHHVVRDDVAMLVIDVALNRSELHSFCVAVDQACRSSHGVGI